MHSAPTTLGPYFPGTTHANQQLPNSAWVVSHGGNVSVPSGQQPPDVASYCLADPSPNTFVPCHLNFPFTPQTALFQASEICSLGQIPEENLANHDVRVENNVIDVGSTEGDSDTSFEDDS